jgi:hypothetical protein
MTDLLGWVATALFALSYLLKRPTQLRVMQAVAACIWAVYGLLLHAAPVVVANIIVAALALLSLRRASANAQDSRRAV